MLHASIDNHAAYMTAEAETGASSALDLLAEAAASGHGFLRAAWFRAAADSSMVTLVGRRGDGTAFAAIPLVTRAIGPLRLREVPGSYWPWRSFPIARDASDAELAALLASPVAHDLLGRAWRLGPAYADDPTVTRLAAAARAAGWSILSRPLSTSFAVELGRLAADGPWPSAKTLRKNRWLERRLAEMGALDFRTVSGANWNEAVFDILARIESESWLGALAEPCDTKFLRPEARRIWEHAIQDPVLAAKMSCSLLHVGGAPAAFTFSIESGRTRYYIANSYSARFGERSPGRILLYRDFQQAAEAGIKTIGWGAGDPGYKTDMGATPGPEILDFLIVRGIVPAALARPLWERRR